MSGLGEHRLRRTSPAHADDQRIVVGQQPRQMAGQGSLAGALAGGDHRQLRPVEGNRVVARWLEHEPRRLIAKARVQGKRGEAELGARPERGLVGQVDHGFGVMREAAQGILGRLLHRPAVDLVERPGGQLLLAAAEGDGRQAALPVEPGECVADGRGMVLAVDQRDDRHADIV